jgi:hypothetical protein
VLGEDTTSAVRFRSVGFFGEPSSELVGAADSTAASQYCEVILMRLALSEIPELFMDSGIDELRQCCHARLGTVGWVATDGDESNV